MKRTLRALPDAEAELQSTALWYEEKRRGLGIEFVAVVDGTRQATPWLLAGSSTVGAFEHQRLHVRPSPSRQ